jgi:hypothetical protein
MNISDRGAKHFCPACATRYYDMKQDTVVCPKCGAAPAAPKLPRSRAALRKPVRLTFR